MLNTPQPFSITVLGSGTCTPNAARGTAGYLITWNQQRYLIDSGSGTIDRLAKLGQVPHGLQAFFYTHLHLDHTGDLFPLLFSMRNSGGVQRSSNLNIYGPKGFQNFFDTLCTVYGRWIYSPDYQILINELKTATTLPLQGGLEVCAFDVKHSNPSVGYRFTAKRGATTQSIAFTGDSDDGADIEKLLQDVDLAVFDCSTLDDDKIGGHLTPGQISRLAKKCGVKQVVLSHFYPPLSHNPTPAVNAVADSTGLPTFAAYDGACYSLMV